MTLALFSLGEPAVAQATAAEVRSKTPPKRQTIALADRKLTPEPR